MKIEHPEDVGDYIGGCSGHPSDYGYLDDPDWCDCTTKTCAECWDREIPEVPTEPIIKDSGERREFDTGAVRDIQEGKGRCDLMPLDVIHDVYKYLGLLDEPKRLVFEYIHRFTETGSTQWLYDVLVCFRGFEGLHDMFLEVSKHFEEGAKKYGEYNWQKGIPVRCYIDSAVRHYLKWLRGDKDEPHDRAFVWNILCCIWTCIHKPELNDYKKEQN